MLLVNGRAHTKPDDEKKNVSCENIYLMESAENADSILTIYRLTIHSAEAVFPVLLACHRFRRLSFFVRYYFNIFLSQRSAPKKK